MIQHNSQCSGLCFKMWIYLNFFMAINISYVIGEQYRYILEHEKLVVEYLDNNVLDATAELYNVNQTKALNCSLKSKIDVTDDIMLHGTAMKRISSNLYGPAVIQISKSIKEGMEMTTFDVDRFLMTFRPPASWPIQKGVTYQTVGWTPDVTKLPPNLPPGNWKILVEFTFGNKSKIGVVAWYTKLIYKH